ncbi:hypothetical protein [Nocardia noduli]|uniref:hypothetical protein n=1 Tax=Nocardia noduli TaxID=2815722 RepID=UPI001C219507|nr:hypothetical protein [Nocardia noduli]
MTTLNVDTANLATLGAGMQQSGGAVEAMVKTATDNLWGSGTNNGECEAGRNYEQQGAAMNTALEKVGMWLLHWSTATKATGAAFGKSSIAYGNTDALNAHKTDKQ